MSSSTVTLAKSSSPVVMLEIIEGDTAFMINSSANKVWWVVGECRKPIPMENKSKGQAKEKSKNLNKSMMSKKVISDVTLGSRQIRLQQQYRFDLANDSTSVSIFNSVRGGWSSVQVKRNDACRLDTTCRSRMELPEC